MKNNQLAWFASINGEPECKVKLSISIQVKVFYK